MLAAIEQIFDETEHEVPQRGVAASPTASTRRQSFIDDDGVLKGEPVPIHVKVTVDKAAT